MAQIWPYSFAVIISLPNLRFIIWLRASQTAHLLKEAGRLRLGALIFGALLATGCADDHPSTRIMFKDATVNDTHERLALDTGSAYMIIFQDSAERTGVDVFLRASPTVDDKFKTETLALAKPARINLGGKEYSVQPIIGNLSSFSIVVAADGGRFDGFVSWPEVRDNILVFDGPEHKIMSVDEVPSYAKEFWTAYPIGAENQLTLKTKLANGQLGTILVDTGPRIPMRQAVFLPTLRPE